MSNLNPKTALDAHLVVNAVGQQGHQDTKAPKVYDLLAELIANSQTGQSAAELTQDAGVVRECCREEERGTGRLGGGRRPATALSYWSWFKSCSTFAWQGGCLYQESLSEYQGLSGPAAAPAGC